MPKQTKIKRLFILDDETEFLFPDKEGDGLILSPDQLTKIDENKATLEAVVILAELDWEGKHLQDFYGFEIARDLRRKQKLFCPLVFISTLEQSLFEQFSERYVKFKILFGRGTAFVPLKDLTGKLEKTISEEAEYPLSPAVLTDMNQMLLEVKGVVVDQYITHDLRPGKTDTGIEAILNEAAGYLNASQLSVLDWHGYVEKFKLAKNKPSEFKKIKEELILRCEQEIGAEAQGGVLPEKRYMVLLLEDDPSTLKMIQEKLGNHFEIIATNDAIDARNKLNKDINNKIQGIISDWRLYKNEKKYQYWQLQGYEVLDYAAKHKFIALFALTSLNDRNVHNIRNSLGLNVHLFKKQHLEDSGQSQWDLMADTIKQKCDDVVDLISFQPTGKRWTLNYYDKSKKERVYFPSLQARYRDIRNSLSWNKFEQDITTKANSLWNYYAEVFDKNYYSWSFSSFKEKFSYEIATKEPKLFDTLVMRRIYLALILSAEKIRHSFYRVLWENTKDMKLEKRREENPVVNAYCVLNGITWEEYRDSFQEKKPVKKGKVELTKEEHASEDLLDKSKAMANLLCFTPATLPSEGILPEERSWLLSKRIDISSGIATVDYRARAIPGEDKFEDIGLDPDKEPSLEDIRNAQKPTDGHFLFDSTLDNNEDD